MTDVRYELKSEADLEGYVESVNSWDYPQAIVVRMEDDKIAEVIGYDGSADSPEDNYLFRDFDFVVPGLNAAYQLGLKHGKGEA